MSKKGRIEGDGVAYSLRTTKHLKGWKRLNEIINAERPATNINKEIRRVFHAANRRLQNLGNSGAYSPAANAVNDFLSNDTVSSFNKFAKFSTAGKSFDEIKRMYNAAIEFLNKPTSTASGAKEFEREIRNRLRLTKPQFDAIKGVIDENGGINDYAANKALLPSDPQKVADFFQTVKNDIADDLERAASAPSKALEAAFNKDMQELNKDIGDAINGDLNEMLNSAFNYRR